MKYTYTSTLAILFFVLSTLSLISQTYVNQNANGSNDGTSWQDAYSSLELALENTNSGEIWVAAGMYTPGGMNSDSSSTFKILGPIQLLGGFNGTETSASERDIANNLTTLNGDINGDDIADDFNVNKSDNIQHVISVDSLITGTVEIDGFTVQGGHTSDVGGQDEHYWRGGGLISYSEVNLSNCIFQHNFGRSGACVYLSPNHGGANNSKITNCTFQNSFSTSQSAGVYLELLADVVVDSCSFINNVTVRGAFYPNTCVNLSLKNSLFDNNNNFFSDGFGGAMFNWNCIDFRVENCTFSNNSAGNGGVIYNDGRNLADTFTSIEFIGCTFNNNIANDFGGGSIYNFNGKFSAEDCLFEGNRGTNGAHIFSNTEDKTIDVNYCDFTDGISEFGGAQTVYGLNGRYNFFGNTYTSNSAGELGGSLIIGFNSISQIDSCFFKGNIASRGGAVFIQNEGTQVNFELCEFEENSATINGGGIEVSGGNTVSIDKTNFVLNSADVGGALSFSEFGTDTPGTLTFSNNTCNFNMVTTQGAALSLVDIDANIFNCVFGNNFNNAGGVGGAMSLNAADSNSVVINLYNSTLSGNTGSIAGIASWTGTTETSLDLTMQNCLLYNNGPDYGIEDGLPNLTSNGGNLISDESMNDYAIGLDQSNAPDAMFVNSNLDFRLQDGSPAIDFGVALGAPEFDIEGNPRVGNVDSGAHESMFVSSTEELITNRGQLKVFPNPVEAQLQFTLDNNWNGNVNFRIYNQIGQLLSSQILTKNAEMMQDILDTASLDSGVYYLIASDGDKLIQTSFLKVKNK